MSRRQRYKYTLHTSSGDKVFKSLEKLGEYFEITRQQVHRETLRTDFTKLRGCKVTREKIKHKKVKERLRKTIVMDIIKEIRLNGNDKLKDLATELTNKRS